VRDLLRGNGPPLAVLTAFPAALVALVAQAFAGRARFNDQLVSEGLDPVGFWSYASSSDFAVDVTENWQSEYLRFLLYALGAVWLVRRGSPGPGRSGGAGTGSGGDRGTDEHPPPGSPRRSAASGRRGLLPSLGLVVGGAFLLSWLAQSVTGAAACNERRLRQLREPIGWDRYLVSADFWNRTLQNWQSELLAVASLALLAVCLRRRGSPEPDPAGSPDGATGSGG
jgi:hypothetical protein